MQKRLSLIIGIILALVTVFMVKMYLDQQQLAYQQELKKRLQAQAGQPRVLVARTDIPKGVAIKADMVATEAIPEQYIQPRAVTSLERIEGMVTAQAISKGEQITLNQLLSTQQASGESLAMATPVGKRAISIMVDNIASLAGMMRPGDYVDVIGMIPVPVQTPEGKTATQVVAMPLFQNVLVLAVGQELGIVRPADSGGRYAKEGEKREGAPIITLALSPQEANLIAFVQEQGKIRFIMRSPADSQVQNVPPASWDTLLQYVMPKQTTREVTEEEPKSGRTVEIYRGLQKEVIPLSKAK